GEALVARARRIDGVAVLAERLEGADAKTLREAVDRLKQKLAPAVVVLASDKEGKAMLVAGVTKDLASRLKAGELAGFVASKVGGKGGGRPDMAQGGGPQPEKLKEALAAVFDWVKERL
ncbi:MAG: alanine--tRNA ligase, partial [Gammaproteobacteria bacterium]